MSQGNQLDVEVTHTSAHPALFKGPTSLPVNGQISSQHRLDMQCHHLFEDQAKKTPHAIAVIFEGQQITYQQLNQKANQLAHYLRSIGVGLETFVGLYGERSIDTIVGILGIFKAGGTYVPIDPHHPADRVAFILQDTQASVILTQAALVESLPAHQATVVCLDTDWPLIAQAPLTDPLGLAQADSLAYTLYTSGSTGQPKGVMIAHSSLCNQLDWRQSTFPLAATDRVLQNISLSFDPSVWQIFWPLCFGAQLVLPRPGGQQDVAYLVQLMAEQQISVIALVPSLLRVFLEAKHLDQCRGLRHVFCGGEALTQDLQQRFFERFVAGVQLHNVYGPTEATIDATCWTCPAPGEQPQADLPVAPIGRPILNAQVYVLDEQLRPLPPGEAGELHIGGAGLARGYLNRPELTAEKFIANPFSRQPGPRLYKTGDLVRYLPDGNLEFLGRLDHQVKIRGFRIELQEIETTLNQHPDVRQSVVTVWQPGAGDKRLAAYIVPEATAPKTAELRAWLQAKLPDYMVPAAFMALAALPLTPNGKVDRRALPEPAVQGEAGEQAAVPQTALEKQLTAIWQRVLQVEPGVHDNFFDLGGNSLLAATLFRDIEQALGREVPVALIFEHPTVAGLAGFLAAHDQAQAVDVRSLVCLQQGQPQPPLFCLHTRTGHLFEYYSLAQHLDPKQPIYGLQAPWGESQSPPLQPLEQIAADYIRVIQTVQPHGPYHLCGYSFGGLLAYEIARQLAAQGEAIALLAMIDTYHTDQPWFCPAPRRARAVMHLQNLQALPWRGKIRYLQTKVKRRVKSPSTSEPLFHTAYEHYFEQVAQAYQAQPYGGKALLFKASQDPVERGLVSTLADPYLGWSSLCQGGVEVRCLPCHHFSLFEDSTLPQLAAQLQAALRASQP
jgi:amino acid adenylation domain-containing protein